MPEINLNIHGRNYRIGCDPGEEERVEQLGQYIDQQVSAVAGPGGTGASEQHLLVLASIIICDELFELKDLLKQAQSQYRSVSQKLEEVTERLEISESRLENQDTTSSEHSQEQANLAEIISSLAGRIETIADRIEKA